MKIYLCDTPECQVVTFTESDVGGNRCPGCGFLGDFLQESAATIGGIRRLTRVLLERVRTPA